MDKKNYKKMWNDLKNTVDKEFKFQSDLRDIEYKKNDNLNQQLIRMGTCNGINNVIAMIYNIENNV